MAAHRPWGSLLRISLLALFLILSIPGGVPVHVPGTGYDVPEAVRRGDTPDVEDERKWDYDPAPVTGGELSRDRGSPDLPSLETFRRHVMNGNPDQLTGIWVEDVLAFHVQQGLTSRAPEVKDTLSIYNWAWKNGVVGLLIHNYRGGTQLYQLNPGVGIAAIYGNGGVDWYLSRGGTWYESRTAPSGGFAGPFRIWSCDGCAFDVSSRDLHNRHYAGNHRLAFQTCVRSEGRMGLVIIEAYLDYPPELADTGGEAPGTWDRYLPTMKKYFVKNSN
jgi:hypothetical protein